MKILFLTKGDKAVASSRQRVWLMAEKLRGAYGYEYEVLYDMHYPFLSFRRARVLKLLHAAKKLLMGRHDMVFIHKSLFAADIVCLIIFAKLILRKKLVYDLDDAEWVHSPVKTRLLMRSADYVLCGSHVILKWAARFNKNALLVPTVLDVALYQKHAVRHGVRERYTIGWIGSGARHFKDGHFHLVRPALDALQASSFTFRLIILGAQHSTELREYFRNALFETVFIHELDWADPEAVPRAIQKYAFDVGIMPQSDTPFNRAKCSFKAIEYMACGVPTIASRIGENSVLIEDGVNGFLAGDANEWEKKLRALLADVSLRSAMGERARATIRERYSYAAVLSSIQSALSR